MDLGIRVAFSATDKITRTVNGASKSVNGLAGSLKQTQDALKDLEKNSSAFDRLRRDATDTARKLANAQRQFDGLTQKQKEGDELTEKQANHLEELRSKITRLTQSYATQTTKLREAATAVRAHGVNLTAGSGAVQSAIRRTEQYSNRLERERQQLALVTRAQARYNSARETSDRLKGTGLGMTATGLAGGYAAGRFLSPAVDFDADMSRVAALTRIDSSSPQFKMLRDQAKQLGADTAFSGSDAAQGQAFLAMAGFTPDAIKAALPGVLNTAIAGGALTGDISLGETADISASILNQFRLKSADADKVGDILAATFTRTATSLRDLGDTMKYTGPVAAGLGIDLEHTAAMSGLLAKNGIRGSDAGTAMRASLSRLASPPKAAADALAELGVSAADARGKMRPIEDVLKDLYKATSKYTDVAQVSFFKDIAGEEAFVGLQALVNSAGSGELQSLLAEIQKANANQEGAKTAKTMSDNLKGDLSNLGSAWEALETNISDVLNGKLRALTQWLDDVITRVAAWVQENPRLSSTLAIIGGSLIAIITAIGGLSLAIGVLLKPLALMQAGFSFLTSGAGWVTMISRIGGMFSGLGAVIAGISAPVALAVAAIVAGGLLIWKYWQPLKAFFGGVFSQISGQFSFLTPVFDAVGAAIGRVWNWFKTLLTPVESSQSALDKCASAGETFGRVLSAALWVVLTPLRILMTGISWVLEKLDLIPDGISKAQGRIDTAGMGSGSVATDSTPEAGGMGSGKIQKSATVSEWDPVKKRMVQKEWHPTKTEWVWDDQQKKMVRQEPTAVTKPLNKQDDTGEKLSRIAKNTGVTADNTKPKRIGPGDIIFKNLPPAFRLAGQYQEQRVIPQPLPRIMQPVASSALSVPAVAPAQPSAPVYAGSGDTPMINMNFYDVGKWSADDIRREVSRAVEQVMASSRRLNRGSFKDRE